MIINLTTIPMNINLTIVRKHHVVLLTILLRRLAELDS